MRTTRTHKPNGDIYFCGVKVYDRFKDSPPAWLMVLGAVAVVFFGTLAINVYYEFFKLFL